MKKILLVILVLCLFCVGLVGCSRTARGFWTGVAVAAAVAYVWCDDRGDYVESCCHCSCCR